MSLFSPHSRYHNDNAFNQVCLDSIAFAVISSTHSSTSCSLIARSVEISIRSITTPLETKYSSRILQNLFFFSRRWCTPSTSILITKLCSSRSPFGYRPPPRPPSAMHASIARGTRTTMEETEEMLVVRYTQLWPRQCFHCSTVHMLLTARLETCIHKRVTILIGYMWLDIDVRYDALSLLHFLLGQMIFQKRKIFFSSLLFSSVLLFHMIN